MVGFYANDAEPDIANQFPSKLASIFGTQKQRKAHEWGILSVWAFAAQCVMDYVEQIPEIDSSQVTLAGHSRCGKVALWSGANDERFMLSWQMVPDVVALPYLLEKPEKIFLASKLLFHIGLLLHF